MRGFASEVASATVAGLIVYFVTTSVASLPLIANLAIAAAVAGAAWWASARYLSRRMVGDQPKAISGIRGKNIKVTRVKRRGRDGGGSFISNIDAKGDVHISDIEDSGR